MQEMLGSVRSRLESGVASVMDTAEVVGENIRSLADAYPFKEPGAPAVSAKRRRSVFGEAGLDPARTDFAADFAALPVHPKTADEREDLQRRMKDVFLFKRFFADPRLKFVLDKVLDALVKVEAAPGEELITQGDLAQSDEDRFYIVQTGRLVAFRTAEGQEEGFRTEYQDDGFFGELALLHGERRAGTVRAESPCVLWALDRRSFQTIVRRFDHQERQARLDFLGKVDLLGPLSLYNRDQVTDALEERVFGPATVVVREGDVGEGMFIVREGEVEVTVASSSSSLKRLSAGAVFGEAALLEEGGRRLATVTTVGPAKLLYLDRAAFTRLMGPLRQLMEEAKAKYHQERMELSHAMNLIKKMGAGASSSSVKEIKIGPGIPLDASSSRARSSRPRSGSTGSVLKGLSRKLRSSAEGSGSERRLDILQSGLEAAEKRADEAGVRCRQLERDRSNLEHRNGELAEEVRWLKRSLLEHPEAPAPPPRPSSSTNSAEAADLRKRLTSAEAKLTFLQEDARRAAESHRKELGRLESAAAEERRELAAKLSASEKAFAQLQRLATKYEAIIKDNISDEALSKATASEDDAAALDSQGLIYQHRIRGLERELEAAHRELAELRRDSHMASSAAHSATVHAEPGGHSSDAQPRRERHASLDGEGARPPSSRAPFTRKGSAATQRRSSLAAATPLKPKREASPSHVDDEIEALLESRQQPHVEEPEDPLNASIRSLPGNGEPRKRFSNSDSASTDPSLAANLRAIRKGTGSLKSVHAMTEAASVAAPKPPPHPRPQTSADLARRNRRISSAHVKELQRNQSMENVSGTGHELTPKTEGDRDPGAHSAPIFYKNAGGGGGGPLKAVHMDADKKRKKKSRRNVGDAELESLAGDSDREEASTSHVPYDPAEEAKAAKPPRPCVPKDSATSFYSSGQGTGGESSEEDGAARRDPRASAKSRDSGYLGDSHNNNNNGVVKAGRREAPSDGTVSVSDVRTQ